MERHPMHVRFILAIIVFILESFLILSPCFSSLHASEKYFLTLSTLEAQPGQEIMVGFTSSPDLEPDAWIGLVPAETPMGDQSLADENNIDYQYLYHSSNGAITFVIPNVSGLYQFRLYPCENNDYPEIAVSETIRIFENPSTPLSLFDENPELEKTNDTLPSFPGNEMNQDQSTILPGMGQVIEDARPFRSFSFPSIADISIIAFTFPSSDQLPPLTIPFIPGLSLSPSDIVPPQVVLTHPEPGSTEIPTDISMTIQFDEGIQPGETFYTILVSDQNHERIECDKEIQGEILVITPQVELEPQTTYHVVLPSQSIKDVYGNSMEDTYIFSFSTVEPPPLSTLSLPFIGGKPEEIIDIPVHFNGYQNTTHFEMELVFNQHLLDFLGVTPGEINGGWLTSAKNMESGRVKIIITSSKDDLLVKEKGIIANMKFQVIYQDKNLVQSELSLKNVRIFDQKQSLLPVTVFNGMFYLVGGEIDSHPTPTVIPELTVSPIPFQVDQADMVVEPSSFLNGKVGEEYNFTATLENVPASIKNIKYQWNFGDGSNISDSLNGEMGHVFSRSGQYEVTVKAFDKNTGQMIAMKKLKVEILDPMVSSSPIETSESKQKLFTHQERYPNGKLKIQYTYFVQPDGTQIKHGLETCWYESGKKKSEGEYLKGGKTGIWVSWYDNGVIGQKGLYNGNKKDGVWIKYYRNGNKESEGSYKNNMKEGGWKKWHESGKLWAEFQCENDQIIPGSYTEYRQ